jgi:hypothetical protein
MTIVCFSACQFVSLSAGVDRNSLGVEWLLFAAVSDKLTS